MKRFWTYIKHKRKDKSSISPLRAEGVLHTTPIEKANILNKQFQSVFSEKSHIPHDDFQRTHNMQGAFPDAENLEITTPGVERLLRKLNPHKAAGPDNIRPRVLKELATEIAPILTIIYRKSLRSGAIPRDWKQANSTKKGKLSTYLPHLHLL
jgi:hypothetical protein